MSEGIIESLVAADVATIVRGSIDNEQTQRAMVSLTDVNIDSVLSSMLHSIAQDQVSQEQQLIG